MTHSDSVNSVKNRHDGKLAAKLAVALGSFFGVAAYLVNGQDMVRAGISALIMGLGGWYLGTSVSAQPKGDD